MDAAERLRAGMDQVRRGLEQAGKQVRRAAKEGALQGKTQARGGRRNVAIAVNVGGDGQARGVSVTQRSRIRADGKEEVETTRTVYGDP
jgi:hypothetical protein